MMPSVLGQQYPSSPKISQTGLALQRALEEGAELGNNVGFAPCWTNSSEGALVGSGVIATGHTSTKAVRY